MTAVGGASRGCPAHGTYARYNGRPGDDPRGCLCGPCREAGRRYRARQELLAATGRSLVMDASGVQAHLRRLVAARVGRNEIARRAGVSSSVVSLHLAGTCPTIRRSTAMKLLAVRAGKPTPRVVMSSVGTVRRLRALAALGHGAGVVSRACGLCVDSVRELTAGKRQFVEVSTYQAVAAASRRLAGTRGTSTRAIARARREGWCSFAAWDDIDDPKARPTRGRSRSRGARSQEIVDDAAELIARRVPREEIARRLDLKWDSIIMAHSRCGVSLKGVMQ